MPPDVLVDADHPNAVEPGRVLDQKPLALGEDGVVRGVPGDAEPGSDPGDGEVVDHQRAQRPGECAAGELRARLRDPCGVLLPEP